MSELHLLTTVRDQLRAVTGYEDEHVDIEPNEGAPAIAADFYIMIIPAGFTTGAEHDGLTVEEYIYSIEIAVALRSTKLARDRHKNLVVELTKSFHEHHNNIKSKVDANLTTMAAMNTSMIADGEATGTCDTFTLPLRLEDVGRIRIAPPELYAGVSGQHPAALIRTYRYGGATRLISR